MDLDGTITQDNNALGYADKDSNLEVIVTMRLYRDLGYTILIYSARNVQTYNASVGKINAFTLPVIIEWLQRHNVPYDEIHVGKPWCGTDGFYVDDRAIRPSEFTSLSPEQVSILIGQQPNTTGGGSVAEPERIPP